MMPPQAEASLALEYSTDTRKLGGGGQHGGPPAAQKLGPMHPPSSLPPATRHSLTRT